MAGMEDPVRSFKANTASLISTKVAIVISFVITSMQQLLCACVFISSAFFFIYKNSLERKESLVYVNHQYFWYM
jgi:hypothetical protein